MPNTSTSENSPQNSKRSNRVATPSPQPVEPLTPESPETLKPELTEIEPPSEAEQIELLQQHVAELTEELSLARHEIAALNPLLLSFGQGVHRCVVNARSIRGLSLRQKSNQYTGYETLEELWAVVIDEVRVTEFLPEPEAVDALSEAEARWSAAISSPTE